MASAAKQKVDQRANEIVRCLRHFGIAVVDNFIGQPFSKTIKEQVRTVSTVKPLLCWVGGNDLLSAEYVCYYDGTLLPTGCWLPARDGGRPDARIQRH